jgi:hypothetical protein
MESKLLQLAVDILAIYCLLGPFVFFGLYIFFDRLAEREPDMFVKKDVTPVHPDLWSPKDIDEYMNKQTFFARIPDQTES